MVSKGKVMRVKRGLYKLTDNDPQTDIVEISKLYPGGVICLYSAWSYFELTDHISAQFHIAFPHKSKIKTIDYPPVIPYFWSEKPYFLGIVEKDGIRIYDREKSVCDAVKFRNKVGDEMMQEVIKNYLKSTDININKLLDYARILRIDKIMMPYLKALI